MANTFFQFLFNVSIVNLYSRDETKETFFFRQSSTLICDSTENSYNHAVMHAALHAMMIFLRGLLMFVKRGMTIKKFKFTRLSQNLPSPIMVTTSGWV
jgi:hypothetical protein